MALKDQITLTGRLKIELNGGVIHEVKNLVVTVGKQWIAQRMQGTSVTVMTHMAIGTGTAGAVIADTALGTEIARNALATSGGTVAANKISFATTYAAGTGTGAITEAGIFNANSAGTMLARTVFAVVNKGASDSMTITWDITVS